MTNHQPDDLLTFQEAAALLQVGEQQIPTMVDEGILTVVDSPSGPRLRRAEVVAAAEMGG